MPRLTHARRAQISAVSAAHPLLGRCLVSYYAWAKAKNPDEQQRLALAYGEDLDELFTLLKERLGALVAPVLDHMAVEQLPEQDQTQVREEVLEHMTLNLFVAIVDSLPTLQLDTSTELSEALLVVAERHLYNID